jgi:hypothetical protein
MAIATASTVIDARFMSKLLAIADQRGMRSALRPGGRLEN